LIVSVHCHCTTSVGSRPKGRPKKAKPNSIDYRPRLGSYSRVLGGVGFVSTPVSNKIPQLISIQVLRALAALVVVFAHLWPYFSTLGLLPNAFPNFILGAAGVDLFFVISGFIMVYTSEPLFGLKMPQRDFSFDASSELCRSIGP
jgi:Acyltransferase family